MHVHILAARTSSSFFVWFYSSHCPCAVARMGVADRLVHTSEKHPGYEERFGSLGTTSHFFTPLLGVGGRTTTTTTTTMTTTTTKSTKIYRTMGESAYARRCPGSIQHHTFDLHLQRQPRLKRITSTQLEQCLRQDKVGPRMLRPRNEAGGTDQSIYLVFSSFFLFLYWLLERLAFSLRSIDRLTD